MDTYSIIEDTMAELNRDKAPQGLYEPIAYTLSAGGKRLRPSLVLMACELFDGKTEEVVPAAVAIEIFHNFTLLHDDVMDHADIRRGQPTVHKKWNENTAILSGDAMVIEAYQMLAKVPAKHLKKVLDLFSKMAAEICEGQQYDVDFEHRNDVSIEDYLEMIRLKTAVLLATSLQIGAIIANAPEHDAELLYQFGINMGLAFQLKDDYLDVYGNEDTFGKAIGGDILCNKKTYLLISAMKHANKQAKQELEHWISVKQYQPQDKIHAVTELYNQIQVGKICEDAAETYNEKAVAILDKIGVFEDKKHKLRNLAKKMMVRNE